MQAVPYAIALLSLGLPLTGCALFVPGVDDARLVAVESVEVGALDLHDGWGDLRPKLPPTYLVGKIAIATKVDIHEIGEEYVDNIWLELEICETGASVTHFPGLYYEGVDINQNPTTEAIQSLYRDRAAAHKDDEPYIYEIYFAPRSTRNEPKGPGRPWEYEPYDFTSEPRALCLQIGGGNMLGGSFVSNTVLVPSSEIGRAFQNVER